MAINMKDEQNKLLVVSMLNIYGQPIMKSVHEFANVGPGYYLAVRIPKGADTVTFEVQKTRPEGVDDGRE